jgi:hypothetical protein
MEAAMTRRFTPAALAFLLALFGTPLLAQESSSDDEPSYQESIDYDGDGDVDEGDLAQAAQNPVADLISVPLQNNATFGIGEYDRTRDVLNIQPVIPIKAGKWNLINRTIVPVVRQPDFFEPTGSTFGVGDITHSLFVSPAKAGKVIWGVGPIILLPTASDPFLGTGKWGLGPSLVVLTMPGRWVLGGLVNNLWSVGGDEERNDVNVFFFQPFVNYNMSGGWYLVSGPIITANWEAEGDNRWTVPVGGGVGKIFRVGKQPMNVNTQLFYNVKSPEVTGGKWEWRVQVQLLFPK